MSDTVSHFAPTRLQDQQHDFGGVLSGLLSLLNWLESVTSSPFTRRCTGPDASRSDWPSWLMQSLGISRWRAFPSCCGSSSTSTLSEIVFDAVGGHLHSATKQVFVREVYLSSQDVAKFPSNRPLFALSRFQSKNMSTPCSSMVRTHKKLVWACTVSTLGQTQERLTRLLIGCCASHS